MFRLAGSSSFMTTNTRDTIDWMGLHLAVPASWQVVRHGLSPRKGSLTLVDRRRQRLQVIWTQCRQRPDLARMISDHRARQCELDPDAIFRPLEHIPGWRGMSRQLDAGEVLTRAAHYHAPTQRLVEAVLRHFPAHPGEADLPAQVLGQLEVTSPADQATRWRAFGIDVQLPAPGWRLLETDIKPGQAMFRFVPEAQIEKNRPQEIVIRRRAMARTWFSDPHRLLEHAEPRTRFTFQSLQFAGHAATAAEATEGGPRIERWFGRLRTRRELVWHCGDEDAVYRLSTLSRARDPLDPRTLRVICCQPLPGESSADFALPLGDSDQLQTGEVSEQLLDTLPVANEAVRAEPRDAGLVLYVPVRRRWWMGPPLGWVLPFRREHGFGVDALGAEIWQACDGEHTTEQIIESFAQRHRVRFHEARLAVLTFLRSMVQRNLVAVVLPRSSVAPAPEAGDDCRAFPHCEANHTEARA